MKLIILEGIATSGKTTIKNLLKKHLKENNKNYKIIEEDETLMPIHKNTDKKIAKTHLKKILTKYLNQKIDYLIFDRLYFTHIHRTNSNLEDFKEIETQLQQKTSQIYYLKINNNKIKERIYNAIKHRPKDWGNYIKNLGTEKEMINYYTNQQKKQLNNLKETKIKNKIYNTTNLEFEKIANQIIKTLKK